MNGFRALRTIKIDVPFYLCAYVSLCRTDVSQYRVYEEGRLVKTVSSLQSYSQHRYSNPKPLLYTRLIQKQYILWNLKFFQLFLGKTLKSIHRP